jgi:hypothetical protein
VAVGFYGFLIDVKLQLFCWIEIGNPSDRKALQEYVNKLKSWVSLNGIDINAQKWK